MASNRFKIRMVDGKMSVIREEHNEIDQVKNVPTGIVERSGSTIKYLPPNIDKQFDDFFSSFNDQIAEIRLSQKQTDCVYSLCERLIEEYTNLCVRNFEKNYSTNSIMVETLAETREYVCKKTTCMKTAHMRKK